MVRFVPGVLALLLVLLMIPPDPSGPVEARVVPRATPERAVRAATVGIWLSTTGMNAARDRHTATLLRDGTVLVAGGRNLATGALVAVDIFNPATRIWATGASMRVDRYDHTATLLKNGKVLVAGGFSATSGHTASAEL